MQKSSSILYCELAPLANDVSSKIQRCKGNIGDRKFSVEHTVNYQLTDGTSFKVFLIVHMGFKSVVSFSYLQYKGFDVVVETAFLLSLSHTKIYFFWHFLRIVHLKRCVNLSISSLHWTFIFLSTVTRSVGFDRRILCTLMIIPMFSIQLLLTVTVFLLQTLCGMLDLKHDEVFNFTLLFYEELNQMVLTCSVSCICFLLLMFYILHWF